MAKEIAALYLLKEKLHNEKFMEKATLAGIAGLGISSTIIGAKNLTEGAIEGNHNKIEAGKMFLGSGLTLTGIAIYYPMLKNLDKIDVSIKNQYHKLEKRFAANPKI